MPPQRASVPGFWPGRSPGLITGFEPGFGSGGVTTMPGAALPGGLMTPSFFS